MTGIKRKLNVRCMCGRWGMMYFKEEQDEEGKEIVNFKCACDSPTINFDHPYDGYYP